jgi:hypothetical protein
MDLCRFFVDIAIVDWMHLWPGLLDPPGRRSEQHEKTYSNVSRHIA